MFFMTCFSLSKHLLMSHIYYQLVHISLFVFSETSKLPYCLSVPSQNLKMKNYRYLHIKYTCTDVF